MLVKHLLTHPKMFLSYSVKRNKSYELEECGRALLMIGIIDGRIWANSNKTTEWDVILNQMQRQHFAHHYKNTFQGCIVVILYSKPLVVPNLYDFLVQWNTKQEIMKTDPITINGDWSFQSSKNHRKNHT